VTVDTISPMRHGVTTEDLAILGRNALLAQLDAREFGQLLESLTLLAVSAGTELAHEGEDGVCMYFVLEGVAVVTRGNHVVRHVHAPEQIGELAMLGVRRLAGTIRAETAMRVARLGRSHFQALGDRHPKLALHLLQLVVSSLGDDVVNLIDSVADLVGRRHRTTPMRIRVRTPTGERMITAGTAIETLLPELVDGQPVVAALLDSKPVMLDTPVHSEARVDPVALGHVSGRDAFRRSVGLLLLEAAYRVAPDLELRLGPAVDDLQVVDVAERAVDKIELCGRLEATMRRFVEEDVEFSWDSWTLEEARAQLMRQGWTDAALLLRTSRTPVTTLQTCGRVRALFVGPLVPSARYLSGFGLVPHPDGFLLDHGPSVRPGIGENVHATEVARELARPRFGAEMGRSHREWLATMGVKSVGDLNELVVRGGVERVIRVAEGFHEKRIGQLADSIAARRPSLRVICIAGPSSSGKTTFIERLSVQLEVAGIQPIKLSLDDYYVDRDKTPRDETGEYDFEALEALDLELLRRQLCDLIEGRSVGTPRFDFKRGKCEPDGGPVLQIARDQVLLVEGIHALDDALWPETITQDSRMRIFVHPATTLPIDRLSVTSSADLRLLRRIVRDRHDRATPAADTIARWASVRRGERRHIYPTYANADAVFDSSLIYEIGVLKVYAESFLLEVHEGHPSFPVAYRLRQLIDPHLPICQGYVPRTSILREFVTGTGL
jgi:uridine kinase